MLKSIFNLIIIISLLSSCTSMYGIKKTKSL